MKISCKIKWYYIWKKNCFANFCWNIPEYCNIIFCFSGCGRRTLSNRISNCNCGCCGPFAHNFSGSHHTFGYEVSKKSCQTSQSSCHRIWKVTSVQEWWWFEQYWHRCHSGKFERDFSALNFGSKSVESSRSTLILVKKTKYEFVTFHSV